MTPPVPGGDSLPDGSGLLFGAVALPPAVAWERSGRQAPSLLHADTDHALRLPGVLQVLLREAFVGVVARTPAAARYAVGALRLRWGELPATELLAEAAINDKTRLVLAGEETSPGPVATSGTFWSRYRWPLAPKSSAARVVAQFHHDADGGRLCVWAPLTDFGELQGALACLLKIDPAAVTIVASPGTAAGDYAVACAAADAALLAHAVGAAVAVDCRPGDVFPGEYRHATTVTSRSAPDGSVAALSVSMQEPPMQAPPLALVLTGTPFQQRRATDECPLPLYYAIGEGEVHTVSAPGSAPGSDAEHALREAMVFAVESHVDEVARATGQDPVRMRLGQLDAQGTALVRQVADRAGWGEERASAGGAMRGRGFAYAHLPASDVRTPAEPGWSAWIVDVEVDERSGDVRVARVVVGQDSGDDGSDPARLAQLQGEAEAHARKLLTAPSFDHWPAGTAGEPVPAAAEGALVLPRAVPAPQRRASLEPLLKLHPTAMLPAAAAVANAIFDATGVRLREPPFAGGKLIDGLRERRAATGRQPGATRTPAALASLAALLAGAAAALLPWGSSTREIAGAARPAANLYSDATLERGRLIAAAGDCVTCHTVPGGTPNAGGLGLPTPFGTIYSTNITPDVEAGIGAWSYAAFERAMRHGVSRDGHRLYPAFPYTAFAKISDDDLQALYAYLMVQPAVAQRPPETKLPFPYGVRPLLAGWNLAFHDPAAFQPDPARSAQWNRGAYLVNGIGHCGACHTPRNALGAERSGSAFLAGGEAEGWRAPALGARSTAPVPWTEQELFTYLRFGTSPQHGPAGGPMRAVVQGVSELAESDARAIAHYLANQPGTSSAPDEAAARAAVQGLQQRSEAVSARLQGPGARLYEGACAVCHEPGLGGLQPEAKLPLALNSNVHDDLPDNLIQVLLNGIEPAQGTLGGSMPAYAETFDDRQIEELAHYLRARFAPGRPAWKGVDADIARVRGLQSRHASRSEN